MNPQYITKRLAELTLLVEELKKRIEALENKPRVGRPPKHEAE